MDIDFNFPGCLRHTRRRWIAAALAIGALLGAAAAVAATPPPTAREPIRPLPLSQSLDPDKVALGARLFADPRLSGNGKLSCASCHSLAAGGADGQRRSIGASGAALPLNTPTVFNAAFNFRQFWDGRAQSLEEQVDGPLLAPAEMGSTWEKVLTHLQDTPAYARAFAAAYPDGVTRANVRHALAEFERSLVTPDARFDRYLRGERGVLSAGEASGYRKFKDYGCVSCHQGVNVGGNMFQRMGVMGDYFADRGGVTPADYGRYNVTRDEADRYFFKVPSLRNVELTAPYFHDGSAATLREAVAVMARYQLGRELPPADLDEIVLFLRTLTGRYQEARR